MATLPAGVRVFVSTEPADMRKSFDGLVALTRRVLRQDPVTGDLFVFVNRSGSLAKILYWRRGGFCVWAKKLEQGRFARWSSSQAAVEINDTQLMMWIDGIEVSAMQQRKRFKLLTTARSSATISL